MRKIFKKRIFNLVLCVVVTLTSLFGAYRFIVEKDHSKEMEELKEKLSENEKLIATLKRLRDCGNTLIVVEHDDDTMRAADYIVDIGPGAGVHGGEIVCAGTLEDILKCEKSETGAYLSGRKKVPVPTERRAGNGQELVV